MRVLANLPPPTSEYLMDNEWRRKNYFLWCTAKINQNDERLEVSYWYIYGFCIQVFNGVKSSIHFNAKSEQTEWINRNERRKKCFIIG